MNTAASNDNSDNFSTNSLVMSDSIHADLIGNINSNSNNNNSSQSTFQNSSSSSSELNSKYERLVQDYVKLRSKLTILKKAYVELQDSSSQKDQSLRKYEQEIESLNFRNLQLTSRVEMLQRELDSYNNPTTNYTTSQTNNSQSMLNTNNLAAQAQSTTNVPVLSNSSSSSNLLTMPSNNASKSSFNSSQIQVLSEELQHKINENASLHRRLNELEVDFRQKLAKNEQSIKQLENERLLLERKLESSETNSKNLIEKLQNDKIKLELNLIQLENQLRATHEEIEQKENELFLKNQQDSSIGETTEKKLKRTSSSGSASISNNNKKDHSSTSLPTVEDSFLILIQTQADNLSKVYAYLDERINTTNSLSITTNSSIPSSAIKSTISPKIALKCEQILTQQLIPLFENKFQKSTPSSSNKSDTDRLLNEFFDSNYNLFQYFINDTTTISSAVQQSNEEIDTYNKKLRIYLNKLSACIFLPKSLSYSPNNIMTSSSSVYSTSDSINNQQSVLNDETLGSMLIQLINYILYNTQITASNASSFNLKFLNNLNPLNDILDKILFILNEKLSLEYTLNYPANLTTIDECIVSYLTQFRQTSVQIANMIQSNASNLNIIDLGTKLSNLIKIKSTSNNGTNSDNNSFNSSGIVDIEKELESLKHEISRKNSEMKSLNEKYEKLKDKSSSDSDNLDRLNFRFEQLQTQCNQLQQREQINLELIQKLKKEKEDLDTSLKESIEEKLKENSSNYNTKLGSDSNSNSNNNSMANQNDNLIGQQRELDKEIESLKIEHYVKKIESLNQRIQLLDSKALFYYDEMKCMLERLKLQIDVNNLQETDINEIKDQLERTRSSYELQMSTMSDHLIEMTDRMSKQADENEKLKHELNSIHQNSFNLANNSINKNTKTSKKK